MVNILCVNHKAKQCGVYEYGKRLFNIWKNSKLIDVDILELDSLAEYQAINFVQYQAVVYNYHVSTMTWLTDQTIQKHCKNVGIPHESDQQNLRKFDLCLEIDPYGSNSALTIPRPMFEIDLSTVNVQGQYKQQFIDCFTDDKSVPIVGSFGFGFWNKNFNRIVDLVNKQYDRAVIKLLIPFAHFGDANGATARMIGQSCMAQAKPGIIVMISHEYFTDEEILLFLSKNTINMFLYEKMPGRSISSTIDYALSVSKPIMISDSVMFRHIQDPSICCDTSTIQNCIDNGMNVLQVHKDAFTFKKCIEKLHSIIYDHVLSKQYIDSFYKSQFAQDRQVLDIVYNKKTHGYFVEIGAYDGIESSNTYVLEKLYKWQGLCVECNPINHEDLKRNRSCHISFDAVYNKDGDTLEFIPAGGLSGLKTTNNHHHINHLPTIQVKTKTLTTLLKEVNAPSFIEFLSLDTEGSELEILKANDWSAYKFGYITVEHNFVHHNRVGIRQFLESQGYNFVRGNNVDDEYILASLASYL